MLVVIVAPILISHVAASIPFWKKTMQGKMPATVDFCCIGLVLYYDIGLLVE